MRRCSIALLGGIGSGKSSVGRLLAEHGADVIDADAIGHEVLIGPAYEQVAAQWPSVSVDGLIDRGRLAGIVFGDPEQLLLLESFTHPHIRARLAELAHQSISEIVVVELPVLRDLLEGRWLRVVVDAPDSVRVDRLVARGMARRDAQARMGSQPSRVAWLEAADFVIDNSGTEKELEGQVAALLDLVDGCDDSTQ